MTVSVSAPADPFGSALAEARAALSAVVDAATWSVPGDELPGLVRQACSVVAAAQELCCRLVAEADCRGVAGAAGASSTAAWVDQVTVCGRRDAGALTRTALGLTRRYQAVRAALGTGTIGLAHAEVICAALDRLPAGLGEHTLAAAQARLVELAGTLDPRRLAVAGRRVWEVVDPAGADAAEGALLAAAEARAARDTWVTTRVHDQAMDIRIKTPLLVGQSFLTVLEGYASPRRTDPTDPDGPGGPAGPDLRPYPARLGQAFTEFMSRVPPGAVPDHGGLPATLVVTIDHDKLRSGVGAATLATGEKISAAQTRQLACTADIIPAVLSGPGVPLDLGRTQRLYTPTQRVALAIRDGGCVFPRCDRPPSWCQAHHIRPWADGGRTDLGTGCLLCAHHHTLIHAGAWRITTAADGHPSVIPPGRVDPAQRPLRNTHLKPKPQP